MVSTQSAAVPPAARQTAMTFAVAPAPLATQPCRSAIRRWRELRRELGVGLGHDLLEPLRSHPENPLDLACAEPVVEPQLDRSGLALVQGLDDDAERLSVDLDLRVLVR